ncbi:MAG: 2OG-Fe(II) oxygenase [Gammaproteobacteria bacterium]
MSEVAPGGVEGWTFLSEYVVEAANHDAAHRHDEAINSLARGVKAGDVESMTRLGKRLFIGDAAPYLPREAVGFLIDAAKAGGAEAPAILAVLSATGAYVAQSWPEGLSALVLAAERGWGPAREQLQVLATDQKLAASAAELAKTSPDIWKRLGHSVAAGPWHLAPEARVLSRDPRVVSFPNLLTPAICEWLVAQAAPRLEPARVYDPVAVKDIIHETRTNSVANFGLLHASFVHMLVQARMAASCGIAIQNFEAPTVLHYRPGQEITNHYDFVDPRATPNYDLELARSGQRVVTFLVYLNDDYHGGETDFPELGVRHKGTKGEGLYFVNAFPDGGPDMRMVHAGRPPAGGDKWIVSQFVRSRAFVPSGQPARSS